VLVKVVNINWWS